MPLRIVALISLVVTLAVSVRAAGPTTPAVFREQLGELARTPGYNVGVAIKDLNSGQEFLINPDTVYPQGSSIRIHLVTELFRQSAAGKLSVHEVRPLPDSARTGGFASMPPVDLYGGATTLKSRSTGFFRLEQVAGRWFFITPEGHGYIPIGINHLGTYFARNENEPDLVNKHDGGDRAKAVERIVDLLKEAGFNFAGYDAPRDFLQRMPYAVGFIPVRQTAYPMRTKDEEIEYRDVFSPEFARELDEKIAAHCRPHRENKFLLGYYLTDLPLWGNRKFLDGEDAKRGKSWISFFRKLPDEAPGKRVYQAFLAERYGSDSGRFHETYPPVAGDLGRPPRIDFQRVDLQSPVVVADDEAFIGVIADNLYSLCAALFHKHDPNHLVLGERFHEARALFEPVLKAHGRHFPVVAVQADGRFDPAYFKRLHAVSGRPVISVDHSTYFPAGIVQKAFGTRLESQAASAQFYDDYLRAAFAEPHVVGFSRCQFATRFRAPTTPPTYKQGVLDPDGEPYAILLDGLRTANRETLARLYAPSRSRAK